MLKYLSSRQIAEWMAYYELEPFGENHGYFQAAIVASTIANAFRSKKRKPFTPANFLPTFIKGEKKEQTTEEVVDTLKSFFATIPKKKNVFKDK